MAIVVNNPGPAPEKGGNGLLIGLILVIVFVAVLIYFGIPALNNMKPVEINVPAPQVNIPAPQINVPAPEVTVTPTTPTQ